METKALSTIDGITIPIPVESPSISQAFTSVADTRSSIYTRYILMYINPFPMELAKLIESYLPTMNIYRFGGLCSSSTIDNTVKSKSFILNIMAKPTIERQWISIPDMPTARYRASAVMLDNRYIYVTCGLNITHRYCTTVECFDTITSKWKTVTPTQHNHQQHITLACNGRIFLIDVWGGRSEIYDVSTNTWKFIPNMWWQQRRWMCVVLWRNRILVFGGQDKIQRHQACLTSCEYFDTIDEKWTLIADMSFPRWGARAAILHDDCIAVMGGSINGPHTDKVELYNPISNKWSVAEWTLPKPMCEFAIHQLYANCFVITNPDSPYYTWLYQNKKNSRTTVSWESLPFAPDNLGEVAFV